jgi:hypothetical protein
LDNHAFFLSSDKSECIPLFREAGTFGKTTKSFIQVIAVISLSLRVQQGKAAEQLLGITCAENVLLTVFAGRILSFPAQQRQPGVLITERLWTRPASIWVHIM